MTWNKLIVLIGIVCYAAFFSFAIYSITKIQSPTTPPPVKCPSPDMIVYPGHAFAVTKQSAYYCPAIGQEAVVVREANYDTYIKCSCSK